MIEVIPKAIVGPRRASPLYAPVPNGAWGFVALLAILRLEYEYCQIFG